MSRSAGERAALQEVRLVADHLTNTRTRAGAGQYRVLPVQRTLLLMPRLVRDRRLGARLRLAVKILRRFVSIASAGALRLQ